MLPTTLREVATTVGPTPKLMALVITDGTFRIIPLAGWVAITQPLE